MIYMTRTGAIAPGKSAAAHAFAQKVATYWKTEWDRTLDIRRPIGGNFNLIMLPPIHQLGNRPLRHNLPADEDGHAVAQ